MDNRQSYNTNNTVRTDWIDRAVELQLNLHHNLPYVYSPYVYLPIVWSLIIAFERMMEATPPTVNQSCATVRIVDTLPIPEQISNYTRFYKVAFDSYRVGKICMSTNGWVFFNINDAISNSHSWQMAFQLHSVWSMRKRGIFIWHSLYLSIRKQL